MIGKSRWSRHSYPLRELERVPPNADITGCYERPCRELLWHPRWMGPCRMRFGWRQGSAANVCRRRSCQSRSRTGEKVVSIGHVAPREGCSILQGQLRDSGAGLAGRARKFKRRNSPRRGLCRMRDRADGPAAGALASQSHGNRAGSNLRLYLYAAARTIGTKSAKTLALLKGRFAALETQPDVRAHDYEYTPVDERIEIAAALWRLDDRPERHADYRDLILRWLKPAPKNLEAARQEAYWDHRWISVNVIENGGRPREAIPLLQAMLKEPRRKPWVDIKVSRALAVMGVSSRPQ